MNMQNQIKSEDCFIAYLDILGFKKLLDTQTEENIFEIFNIITNREDFKIAFHRAVSKEKTEVNKNLETYNETLDALSFYVLSDSVVVSIPSRFEFGLYALIEACIFLQVRLYDINPPVFLRGAITKGKYFQGERIAFGRAMVDAYLYEEYYSKYPRIILNGELANNFLDKDFIENYLHEDEGDKYLFIDCLKERFGNQNWSDEDVIRFSNNIQAHLDAYEDQNIREKYIWLRDNFNRVIYSNEIKSKTDDTNADIKTIQGVDIYFKI